MKKVALLVLLAVFAFGFTTEAKSQTVYSLTVSYEYTPPQNSTTTGYKLYKEGVLVAQWDGGNIFVRQLVLSLPETTDSIFTLTAVSSDGKETPHSAPYVFNPLNTNFAKPQEFRRIASMLGSALKKGMEVRCGNLNATS
jgi:hypothetical protein